MFIASFFGLWIRFIFVYKLNWNRMDIAIRNNYDLEKDKNTKAGLIGLAVIFVTGFLYYELTNLNINLINKR